MQLFDDKKYEIMYDHQTAAVKKPAWSVPVCYLLFGRLFLLRSLLVALVALVAFIALALCTLLWTNQ